MKTKRLLLAGSALLPAVLLAMPAKTAEKKPAAGKAPTVAEAKTFLDEVESKLLSLATDAGRSGWVQSTYITDDTEILAAQANERLISATVAYAKKATRFDGVKLP
jgi:peptidyl-dipeptidase A